MSSQCCVDPGSKQSHEAQDGIEEIAGINTYKTGQDKSAIVFIYRCIRKSIYQCTKISR